jgi:thiol:disulfide interchange protein DsbA
MKRRDFALAASATALALPFAARAQMKPPEDGRDYRTLDKRVAVEAPAPKVEVVDFFWYNCPHCNAFEPSLQAWIKKLPDDVVIRRVPVAFRDNMVPQQRLYYVLESMGKVADMHVKVYDAIHKENVDLTRLETMAPWVAKQGIDPARFSEIYNSFTISARARRASEVQDAYAVEGVPALGIAGRWYTDTTLAVDGPRTLRVADFLIGKAREAK